MIAAIFLDTAARVAPIFRCTELAAAWSAPSALAEFRVSGLAGHLGRAVFNVERYLDTPLPDGPAPLADAVEYYLHGGDPRADLDDAIPSQVRTRGEEAAGTGPDDLAQRFDEARARLAVRLAQSPDDRPVLVFGQVLPLNQCLITRLVELAVHVDDLAASLGLSTPDISAVAADIVVSTLARIALGRHGGVPVIRALSRRERTDGPVTAF